MPAKKFLRQILGVLTEIAGVQTSAGASNAGDIPALDDSGKLDMSLMPVGIAAETDQIVTSENLSSGEFVNLYNSSGIKARKADATTAGKDAHGFVMAATTSGQTATVYRISQSNSALSGMTPGARQYLSTTAGGRTETPPSASGNVIQCLGVAKSATELIFAPSEPITLA
jgi:hypothetical protein